ncbi:MAG TPA: efflux RND transporter permease subunit [Caulobacteraceae bacterium]|nr:efflux RND transporter permease subunit [Caulobacteraceae bacterium]
MTFAERLAAHRRSLLALLAIVVFAGVAFGVGLPVGLFPNIAFPRISIVIDAGDRPIDQMDVAITRPLAQAVRAVPGVLDLRSTTSRGSAELEVNFAWGSDMDLALQRTQSALSQASSKLPPGVTFTVRRMDTTVFPVAAYSLTSASIGPVALRRYADATLTPLLTAIPGVARVDTIGGGVGEFEVIADPATLRGYGLTEADLTAALANANVLAAAGKIEDRGKLYLTLNDSALTSAAQIGAVVVKSAGGGIVRLGDVATVRMTSAPAFSRVTADGRPAVSIQVYQQPSGDTVRIAGAVEQVFAKARATAPAGLTFRTWYDQSELIVASAQDLAVSIAIGAVLAGLVLLVFLRNVRVTLIAVVVVPVVLAITTLMLQLLGQTFNIMTLGGMAAAVGLIIDDAIVMIEHMERRLTEHAAEGPGDRLGAMREAAHEFLRPLSGSSAATILIFLPLAFLSGVTGAFFRALALTMAVALISSFLIAWLVVPILVERLYATAATRTLHGPGRLVARYRVALEGATVRPMLILAAVAALAIGGGVAFAKLPSGFMPAMDEGGFVLDYVTPPGTSITESDRLVRQIEAVLARTPEVATYSRRTGAQLGGALTESNIGDFFVRLKPRPRRDIDDVMSDVRGQVQAQVPGVDIETAQLMEDLIGDLTAVPEPIEVKLYSEDAPLLDATAKTVADKLGKVAGITEIRDGVVVAGDAIDLHFDLARAALAGVTPSDAASQVTAMIDGDVATQVQSGPILSDVRVWIPPEQRNRVDSLGALPIKTADGHIVTLSQIADVSILRGQTELARENSRRMVAVTARVEGRDMGSAAQEANQVLSAPGALPAGVSFEMGGLYAQQQAAFSGLAVVFVAAMAIVMLLLLLIYENFRIVAAIVAMPLLAAAAVGLGLILTGTELNIMALMGLTMVIGIVTEVAIFYFTEFDHLLSLGEAPHSALIDAGANRLRPIAMTTIAAILALAPLAVGHSMQKPLAVAIIAGLIAQGPLVLLVMPALFKLIGGLGAATPPNIDPVSVSPNA